MQASLFLNKKISLGQISQSRSKFCNRLTESVDNNHISWQQTSNQQLNHQSRKQTNNRTHNRRRIFDKFQPRIGSNKVDAQISRSKSKHHGKLNKVKNNRQVSFVQQKSSVIQPITRIQQINRQLKEHRQNLLNSKAQKRDNQISGSPQKINWANIQQRLVQSQQILKRQDEILSTKIPTFQKKIEDNNVAIHQVTRLLKIKLDSESKTVQNLYQLMQKNEDRIKYKQQELSKINSELLLKQCQIMKSKQFNKRRQLQLQRIKRIEDLQDQNLQIYQQIQKKDKLSKFQDFNIQGQDWDNRQKCWGEQQEYQKITNRISTINLSSRNMNNYSQNETIGELLSPLELCHQYLA